MNSRLERYKYDEEKVLSRMEKNREIYNNIDMSDFSKYKPESNEKVIETSPKTIDIEKIKKYIESNNEEKRELKRSGNIVVANTAQTVTKPEVEKKLYDINSVLERAKENREIYYEEEKYKKLRDTQYDILSKIEMYDEAKEEEVEFNTDERTLIDLINTVTINKKSEDLFEELKGGEENTIVTGPIIKEEGNLINETQKEIAKDETPEIKELSVEETMVKNLDKSFYTNSMSFSKEDFEGFEELEKNVKKNNTFAKAGIIILFILIVVTMFIVFKYVLKIL